MTCFEEAATLAALNREIAGCQRCPRLRSYCQAIGKSKRRAYREWEYWAKPVPSFGDERARVLILGLAPGAHGSNRTGRPFTGDGSGDFLYPVLHETGFASQPLSTSRADGMILSGCWIGSVVRCAPPANKPEAGELANCRDHLDREIALLANLRVIVCLGRISFAAFLRHLKRSGREQSAARFVFSHGAEYALAGGQHLLASFHPSLQNTNTGKLTRPMFLDIFKRARSLAGLRSAPIGVNCGDDGRIPGAEQAGVPVARSLRAGAEAGVPGARPLPAGVEEGESGRTAEPLNERPA